MIVRLDDRFHVHRDDLAVSYDDFAVDHGVVGALRCAEESSGNWVVKGASVADGMEVEREEVGTFSWFE